MKKQLQFIKLAVLALAIGVCGAAQAQTGMATVTAGPYVRGDANDGSKDAPTNRITISGFTMDANLVSLALWQTVYNYAIGKGYTFDHVGAAPGSTYPVQSISWYDAAKWCNARSEMEGRPCCYYTDTTFTTVYRTGVVKLTSANVAWTTNGYRLATEAEWEKAARGNLTGHRFPLSDTISHTYALYNTPGSPVVYDLGPLNVAPTSSGPVGVFPANGYGLRDMAGNMREWCWDWYGTNYYATSPTTDPTGPTSGTSRVTRGGSWADTASNLRCAIRSLNLPTAAGTVTSFRTVMASSSNTQTPTVTVTVGAYIYNGSAQGPGAGSVNTGGSAGAITLSYAGVSGTVYGPTAAEPTGAGNYTVTASVAAAGNYNAASSVATPFIISKATPSVTVNAGTYVFTGAAQGPGNADVNAGGSTGAISLSYAGTGGTVYGPSSTPPTQVGTYSATATVAADSNYNQGSGVTVFSILAASNGTVNPTQLANLLGTGTITLPELQSVLADYDHTTGTNVVNYTALLSFLGSDAVTVNDLQAFLNSYHPSGTVSAATLNAVMGGTTNSVDQNGLNAVLAHYWASNPPYISNLAASGATNFVFSVSNFTFTVQVSTNLNQNNWREVCQAVFQFTDTNALANPNGFYRIVTPAP